MNNTEQIFPQNLQMQGILDKYLNFRATAENLQNPQGLHLNEDSLTALIEGNLNRYESANAVNHLVECSFCRHITAELIQLNDAFDNREGNFSIVSDNSAPSGISEVLSGLLSKLFGTGEGAVFAHQEKDDSDETAKNEDKK